ncbi:MAG: DUF4153 domain-containing protein [Candidatus Marinimicrobia bacterium]|nr:DUF4153 domain-containing protein [Candidatus Neomarinimicrobiota bacterium]
MKEKITANVDNAKQLEKLYRSDQQGFANAFFAILPEIADTRMAEFWKARLDYEERSEPSVRISATDILYLIAACVLTGLLIKIPQWFGINAEEALFYEKNAGLIVLFGLSFYAFLTKNVLKTRDILITAAIFLLSAVYINLLPTQQSSDSILLAFLHLPLMLWCLYGLVFIDFDLADTHKRIDYIKYNGELAILVALIAIAGGMLTGVTIGLFAAIEINIEQWYFDYIVIWGAVSAPIVATFIVRKFPFVANKIVPIIANIFSPLVLITLVVYLISIVLTGKDPYHDRDFLLVFNLLLLGVMGIIAFAVSETSMKSAHRFTGITLLALVLATLITDVVALSAILYRLGEYGLTPNRTAVLGANLLIFGNLVLIMRDLYGVNFKNRAIDQVEITIAKYLPIYAGWTVVVVFGFPLMFGWK